MQDNRKTKSQLIKELAALRQRVAELENQPLRWADRPTPSPDPIAEALRRSEKLHQTMMTALPEAITLSDLSNKITFANAQTARLHGYEHAETLLGMNVFELIAPSERQRVTESVRVVLAGGATCRLETELLRNDGQSFFAELIVTALCDEQGLPQTIIGITHDITDHKRAEIALRVNEERLRLALEAAHVGAWDWDSLTNQAVWSESNYRVLGYEPGSVEARYENWLKAVHPDDREQASAQVARAMEQQRDLDMEFRVVWPDGSVHWIRAVGRIVYDDREQLRGMLGLQIDITASRSLVEALRDQEQKFRSIVEQASEGIFLVDEESRYIEVNAALERLTGLSRDDMLGRMSWEINQRIAPRARRSPELAEWFETIARATDQTEYFDAPIEYSIQHVSGELRAVRQTLFPIRTERGFWVGGILLDITGRKQAEEEVQRLNFELEQRVIERTMELEAVNEALQDDIRQRQRIEEMLRRSEHRYRTLFEGAGDAIFILTLSGQFVEANRAAFERLGYSHGELLQKNVADINAPVQRPHVPVQLEQIRHQGQHAFEAVYQRREGTLIHVEVNSRIVEYAGRPAILSIVRDITERKQIEETLRRSEASLAEAQRIAHFGSWTWDLATGKLQCSDEMFRIVGLLPQEVEVTQEVFLKFLHPDEVEWILQEIQYVGANEPPAGLEHRITRSNGEIRNVYSRVKVYRDENGNPLRLLGSTQDITDLKQAEQALRQYADEQSALYEIALRLSAQLNTHELLQLLVEQAVTLLGAQSGGLYLYDAPQDTLVLTQAIGFFSEYVGAALRPGEGLPGRAFQTRQVLRVQDYEAWEGRADLFKSDRRLKAVIATPLLGKLSVLGVLIMADYEGKHPFSDHAARLAELFAAQAAIALENAQLYETQQEQYRRLQDAQTQLIQSEKISALGRLLASISHEINNPLQAVLGCLTLVREGLEEGSPIEHDQIDNLLQDLDMATTEVQRIAGIVQRLHDFYRPARAGLQPVKVQAVLDAVLTLTSKQLQHSQISVEQAALTSAPIVITTNVDQLKQVLLNLLLNAIDAMPDGGYLRISTNLDTLSSGDESRPAVRIDLADSGHGISPEDLSRIFEPFFTTKEAGSGLGLSISYELVHALGGDIAVASEVGVGSTFTIRLPFESAD